MQGFDLPAQFRNVVTDLSDRVIIVPLALKDKDPVLLDGIYEAIFFIDPPARIRQMGSCGPAAPVSHRS